MVVPVRSFDGAKTRLAHQLDPERRAALARSLATGVVAGAGDLPVLVVTADPDVAAWAVALGAEVVVDPGTGLDGAVDAGREAARRRGVRRIVVAHADLPVPGDLRAVGATEAPVVLVPDRRLDGTNVIALDLDVDFRFHYGPGSFARHRAEAARAGVVAAVLEGHDLGWDVDEPEDLAGLALDELP